MNVPRLDPAALLRWCDGSPLRWLALLAAASPWIRVAAGPVSFYPLHIALTLLLAWTLLGTQAPALRLEVPLLPAVALIAWITLVALFRWQWGSLGATLVGGGALWIWGWAASAVGRQVPLPRYFPEAALLFLVSTLAVGSSFWAVQYWAPAACAYLNCEKSPGVPYPFRGGWHSTGQYVMVLVLLLPFCVDPLVRNLRDPRAGRAKIAMVTLTVVAGLALLAGARWWVLAVVALGLAVFARVLASDRHPLDRLFVRGMVFFTLFGAVALYGLVPGYLGHLVSGRGDARTAGIVAPPGAGVTVLSSDRVTPVTVQLVNTGWTTLRATPEHPLIVRALLLFTPRTGQTRAYPGGELRLEQSIAPGDAVEISVPMRLPHWVNTGFVMWQMLDTAGAAIPVTDGSKGFRFSNASFYSLDQAGENQLTAIAGRARAYVTRALPPPRATEEFYGEGLAGSAFDTLFFSPMWGHRTEVALGDGPLNPVQSVWLQVLHGYGLIGLGLAAWLGLRGFGHAWQLSLARERGAARLAWRMLPVSVFLLATVAMLSGEPARYHSLWGCFLLLGFLEGAHARLYPGAPRLRFTIPDRRSLEQRWRSLGTLTARAWAQIRRQGGSLPSVSGPKLPSLKVSGLKFPSLRIPRFGVPRFRLPRLLRRRAASPLYPRPGGRRWWSGLRIKPPRLPGLRLPRWRLRRKPPTRRR